jgi:nitrate/nitrite transporter NarK
VKLISLGLHPWDVILILLLSTLAVLHLGLWIVANWRLPLKAYREELEKKFAIYTDLKTQKVMNVMYYITFG